MDGSGKFGNSMNSDSDGLVVINNELFIGEFIN